MKRSRRIIPVYLRNPAQRAHAPQKHGLVGRRGGAYGSRRALASERSYRTAQCHRAPAEVRTATLGGLTSETSQLGGCLLEAGRAFQPLAAGGGPVCEHGANSVNQRVNTSSCFKTGIHVRMAFTIRVHD